MGQRASTRFAMALVSAALCAITASACQTVFDGEVGSAFGCSVEGAYGIPNCPAGQTCVAGVCSSVGVPFGFSCQQDAECRQPAYCFQPSDVGVNGEGWCSRNCCSSQDCGPPETGHVCYSPPGGAGSVCWPAAELDIGALGDARGGDSCEAGGDCRSGVCKDGHCVDSCCDDSYCGGEQVCRIKVTDLAQREIWACAPPAALPMSTACDEGSDCYHNVCIPMGTDLMFCAEPCCSSTQCGTRTVVGQELPVACAPLADEPERVLRTCSKLLTNAATGNVGSPCSDDSACRSGVCADAGYCSDSCCTDSDCGDITSFSCRAQDMGDTWALRCVRK